MAQYDITRQYIAEELRKFASHDVYGVQQATYSASLPLHEDESGFVVITISGGTFRVLISKIGV